MNLQDLWAKKIGPCKDLLGAVAVHNFDQNQTCLILSDKLKQNLTPATKFQAASLSKLIGAIVCSLYLESKKKSINASLSDELLIPVIPQTSLQHLFSHSAGVNVSGFPGYKNFPTPKIKEVIKGGGQVNTDPIRQILPFGRYSYSGGGYCLAQEYIERLSGVTINKLAAELLFQPLSLSYTHFEILQNDYTCAIGYDKDGNKVGNGWHLYPETLAAGLWTTPSEYLKLLNELIKGYYDESSIIPQKIAKQILTPVVSFEEENQQYKYALGVQILENIYFHSGSNCGYKNLFAFDLENRNCFVIMTDDDNAESILTL